MDLSKAVEMYDLSYDTKGRLQNAPEKDSRGVKDKDVAKFLKTIEDLLKQAGIEAKLRNGFLNVSQLTRYAFEHIERLSKITKPWAQEDAAYAIVRALSVIDRLDHWKANDAEEGEYKITSTEATYRAITNITHEEMRHGSTFNKYTWDVRDQNPEQWGKHDRPPEPVKTSRDASGWTITRQQRLEAAHDLGIKVTALLSTPIDSEFLDSISKLSSDGSGGVNIKGLSDTNGSKEAEERKSAEVTQ